MTRFQVEFLDPETREPRVEIIDCEPMPGIASAREVAEDWAYNAADKGRSTITEITDDP